MLEDCTSSKVHVLSTRGKNPTEYHLVVEPENISAEISIEYTTNKTMDRISKARQEQANLINARLAMPSWWTSLSKTYKILILGGVALVLILIVLAIFMSMSRGKPSRGMYSSAY
jgi:subtilase family serine protease